MTQGTQLQLDIMTLCAVTGSLLDSSHDMIKNFLLLLRQIRQLLNIPSIRRL